MQLACQLRSGANPVLDVSIARRRWGLSLAAAMLFAPLVTHHASAEALRGWDKPMHGVAVVLPASWSSKYSPGKTEMLTATCNTEACRSTQEVCTVVVTSNPISLSGYLPSSWLVSLTIGSDKIRKSVLKGSHEGAKITKQPGGEQIGDQSWYTAESLAPYGWKSLFHATAVIDKRFIRVRCRTCERSDKRFDFARKFVSSLSVKP